VLQRVDPARFLREVAAPYRTAPPEGVRVEERHVDAPAILADPIILARAIVNLIENALQAMPHGGTLTVGSHPGDPARSSSRSKTPAPADPGGARAPVRALLLHQELGTGLGLAIVRRVVLGHGGSIDVLSAQGRGTAMRIRLKEAPRL